MNALFASIPSPSSDQLPFIGVKYYGLMIALGVLCAVSLARRRWGARGFDPDQVADIAVWAVPAGLIGARLYHVITDWNSRYSGNWWPDVLQIWKGGLGIPGGIFLGTVGGLLAARLYKVRVPDMMDAMAPAIPLAQALGRLGNYFNQELYGRPSTLPWAVEIDPIHRQPPEMARFSTFHPTFLYEGLWNIGVMLVLIAIDRTRVLKRGKLFALYLGFYFLGRLWVESIRIDKASELFGLRVNTVLSLTMIVVATVWFLAGGFKRSEEARTQEIAEDQERIAAGLMNSASGESVPSQDAVADAADSADSADSADAADAVDTADAVADTAESGTSGEPTSE